MIGILSPLSGWIVPLEHVPDPVFAEKMLGEGVAIDPVDGRLVSPAAGIVETVHEAGHALTLALDEGPVLLIHIGLDTVALRGAGFRPQVSAGQRVAAGEPLILFDLDWLARNARSLVTPIILTNGGSFRATALPADGPIGLGEPLYQLEGTAPPSLPPDHGSASVSRTLRLQLAHGLHARPAARLSRTAAEFDALLEIVASSGQAAPVRSPIAMLGLGLRHGEMIIVRGSGGEARQAVDALVALIDSGMGEMLAVGKASPDAAPVAGALPPELRGISAVPGVAIGKAWRLKLETNAVPEHGQDPDQERGSLRNARSRVESRLEAEARGEGPGATIAEAHLAMIADPMLDETAQKLISSGKSAAFAWREAIRQCAAPLRSSTDPRFAERLDDLEDLERRVSGELTGKHLEDSKPPAGSLLVADTIYPSQLKSVAEAGIVGVATARGGATSHAAIIAAGLGLPMLTALGPQLALVEDGTDLILRGDVLEISPARDRLAAARDEARDRAERLARARSRADQPAQTADGTRIEVFANLGSVAEAGLAVTNGAEGCGLLRTEFLFLERAAPPDEAEQRGAYQAVADALGTRPLVVRTLDIGADKPAAWLPMDAEDNPALGLRGIRLQLARSDLLETQLRALLGVRSSGPLRIMLPMVSSLAEIGEARAMLLRLAADARRPAPELGIMVETPAAALMAEPMAAQAAFFSVGSNDLSQYALARDRTNPAVAKDLDGLDPAVLRLIDATARGAQVHGRVTGVCGGLAAIPEAIPILIGLGVTELSVPASAIPEVKAIVRGLDLSRCRDLAREALAAPDAGTVRALASPFLEQRP